MTAGEIVQRQLVVPTMADYDIDGDVDQDDFMIFQGCSSGPAMPRNNDNCVNADFDEDGDVDSTDFAFFQRFFSGPDQVPDPNCAR